MKSTLKLSMEPTEEHIHMWIHDYVPEKDVFYLREEDVVFLGGYLHNVLVIPEKEFFKHSTYQQIQWANSYEYWNRSHETKLVLLAEPHWITTLPINLRKRILVVQAQLGRGLILAQSYFETMMIPSENLVKKDNELHVVLHRSLWDERSYEEKAKIIKDEAQDWEDWSCYEVPEDAPHHVKNKANTFPFKSGSNCLSTALYAVTGQEWMLHEWVHSETFLQTLNNAGFFKTEAEQQPGDVLIWHNAEGIPLHASYYLGNNLFFNKNGQTFFNPWKVVNGEDLHNMWGEYHYTIYRKKSE